MVSEAVSRLSQQIKALSASDQSTREAAAAQLFAQGRELARPAIAHWLADEQLAHYFVLDASRAPHQTVGIAVHPANFESTRAACGSPPLANVPPDQDALEFELEFPTEVRLDILTSRHPAGDGAIARFLQKFGEGIQQVELQVSSVDAATQLLRDRFQVTPVFPATRPGANNTRINFFLVPLSTGPKVLIELVEAPPAPHSLC